MARISRQEREEAIARLREWCKPGETVWTVLRHVSASGMSRSIDAYVFLHNDRGTGTVDGRLWLSYNVALAGIGSWDSRRECVKIGGTGMDMGFHLVYSLSRALFPDGFGCLGEGCPSNDHANGDRDYAPHMAEEDRRDAAGELCECHAEHWHRDGGYALRHQWI